MAPAPSNKDSATSALEDLTRGVDTLEVGQKAAVAAASSQFPSAGGQRFFVGLVDAKNYEETRKKELETTKFPHYLPVFTSEPAGVPVAYDHVDPGLRASPTFENLFPKGGSGKIDHITPGIGSEVNGVQLLDLTPPAKDDLARLVAERGVVAFRNQSFKDAPLEKIEVFARYFGQLSIHPMASHAQGHPEILSIARAAGDERALKILEKKTNLITWHSDISYEVQTPGATFLWLLEGPTAGGDTLFADAEEAYKRLSKDFRKRLHGLRVVHSSDGLIGAAVSNNLPYRRPILNTSHPLIRTHPVTGKKGLFFNEGFTRYIEGLKDEESTLILDFLSNHIALGQDFQARVKWEEGTVVVWDNRNTNHTAIVDWHKGERRLLGRVTPLAGPVVETPWNEEDEDKLDREH